MAKKTLFNKGKELLSDARKETDPAKRKLAEKFAGKYFSLDLQEEQARIDKYIAKTPIQPKVSESFKPSYLTVFIFIVVLITMLVVIYFANQYNIGIGGICLAFTFSILAYFVTGIIELKRTDKLSEQSFVTLASLIIKGTLPFLFSQPKELPQLNDSPIPDELPKIDRPKELPKSFDV